MTIDIGKALEFLEGYDGPQIKLMEVCGTHTSSIARSGVRGLISPRIKLISGPGCPVCVTPAAYIDKCIEYAHKENHALFTFGDMVKVMGTDCSLSAAKGAGARVDLMYSPFEVLTKAERNPETVHVIAAVGFETTAPAYALLAQEAKESGISNVRLLTALKRIMPALTWICENERSVAGFICPGHVSAITGNAGYEKLCAEYGVPCAIAGFEPEHIIAAVHELVLMSTGDKPTRALNLYAGVVRKEGNVKAQALMDECFREGGAVWRGLGMIEGSGLYLGDEYAGLDGGSLGLDEDRPLPDGCGCGDVITGRINPDECPMFGGQCTPEKPYGPCMTSSEGACGIWFMNRT